MTPKRKLGRPATRGPTARVVALRCSVDEVALLERAAEQLRRQTGEMHTVSSVLRDGGLEYARKVLNHKKEKQ